MPIKVDHMVMSASGKMNSEMKNLGHSTKTTEKD